MDVRQWRIELRGNSGNFSNQPGLALALRLRCPVCKGEPEVFYARTITPAMIRDGRPIWFGGPFDAGWTSHWFDAVIKERLTKLRSCDECGVISVIPPLQEKALIVVSNAAMSTEWLRNAVAYFEFETREIHDNQYHDYVQEVFVAKDGIKAMDWVSFEPAPV